MFLLPYLTHHISIMVNIVENWAEIDGTIKSAVNSSNLKGYIQLQVILNKSLDINPYPNLAKADEGSLITIYVSTANAERAQLVPGAVFNATVRKGSGQIYFAR
jgi:hypothetical protein